LFFCGRKSKAKLTKIGINTIGDLAQSDVGLIRSVLKPAHGQLLWEYAHGIDYSKVTLNSEIVRKGIGNSTTTPKDVLTRDDACVYLLALSDKVAERLRKEDAIASVVSITLRNSDLQFYRHQVVATVPVGTTTEIYTYAKKLFDEIWKGEPLRQLGVHLSNLSREKEIQLDMFMAQDRERLEKMDQAVDAIRARYGSRAITRGTFSNGQSAPQLGGVNDGNYLMMGGFAE
jgi:DNA polymerase-4